VKKKYHSAVIGLGRAGFLYDGGSDHSTPVRSHTAAYLENPRTLLVGTVERDHEKRNHFRYHAPGHIPIFDSPEDLFDHGRVDIVSVCTPANTHYSILKRILEYGPPVIFCEKPFTESYGQSKEIHEEAKERGIAIGVNYHRRWDEEHRKFFEIMGSEGEHPSYIRGLYGKGFENYASHMVDLFLSHFGPIDGCRVIDSGGKIPQSVMNISFSLFFNKGFKADIIGIDGTEYDLWEVEIFYPSTLFSLKYGGAKKEIFTSQEGVYYMEYKHAVPDSKHTFRGGPVGGLGEAVDNLVAFLDHGHRIHSDSESALNVHRVLESIKASLNNNFDYIEVCED